jgi:hypothetical protein
MLGRRVKHLVTHANRLLEPLERFDVHSDRIEPGPVLILGPPRSGTTLAYQLLVQTYQVAYLTNAHHALFGAPFLIDRLVPRAFRRPPASYRSSFGKVEGMWAPSEAGNFWYRFFPLRPHAVSAENFADADRMRLRRAYGAMTAAARAPVIAKNVVCSLRVEAISSAIPEMRYVVVTRDLVDNAASILASRRSVSGSPDAWWSVEPPEIDQLRALPAEAQAVEQVRAVERAIQMARRSLANVKFVDLSYERLTSNPREEVARIAGELQLSERAGAAPMPDSFPRRQGLPIDGESASRLQRHLEGSR